MTSVGTKTAAREIKLPYASPLLIQWLEAHPEKDNPQALLFPMTYNELLYLCHTIGKKIKMQLHPHHLRHCSATWWSSQLPDPQFYMRFGWVLGSSHARKYVNKKRALENEAATDDSYMKTEGLDIKARNERLEGEMVQMRERFGKLQDFMTEYAESLEGTREEVDVQHAKKLRDIFR